LNKQFKDKKSPCYLFNTYFKISKRTIVYLYMTLFYNQHLIMPFFCFSTYSVIQKYIEYFFINQLYYKNPTKK